MARTLDYYNRNAEVYALSTVGCMMDEAIGRFLRTLDNKDSVILDFGCGSGRDSKVFLEKGYNVVASDGSYAMCKEAERLLGRSVKHMLFEELSDIEEFDGIWACASLLHLPYKQLEEVMVKMERALKAKGVIYSSFRYGEMEGLRGDRYFTDMNEEKVANLIAKTNLSLVSSWISQDVRLDRFGDNWLNVLLRKD